MVRRKDYETGVKFVVADADYTWGYLSGFLSANSLKGDFSDWVFARGVGATEDSLATGTVVKTPTEAANYLDFTTYATNTVWMYFPVASEGYRTFMVVLTSSFTNAAKVTAYAVTDNIKPLPNGFQGTQLLSRLDAAFLILPTTDIANTVGAQTAFGPGGTDFTTGLMVPIGGVILKLEKGANAPGAGQLRINVTRQK